MGAGSPAGTPSKIRFRLLLTAALRYRPPRAAQSRRLLATSLVNVGADFLAPTRAGRTQHSDETSSSPSSSYLATAGRSKPFHTVPTDAAKGQLAPPEAKLQRKDFRRAEGAQMTQDRRCEGLRRGRVRRALFRRESVTSQSRKRFHHARSMRLSLPHQLPRFRASRVSLRFLS